MPSTKYITVAQMAAAIDAQREDPNADQAREVQIEITAPVTEFNMAYSNTVVVNFEEGRFPAWFAPFKEWFPRRLDLDPSYGFYVQHVDDDGRFTGGHYFALPLTALVRIEPQYDVGIIERMAAAAKAAGWSVQGKKSGTPGFTAWEV